LALRGSSSDSTHVAPALRGSSRGFGLARLSFDMMASAWLPRQQWRGSDFVKLRRDAVMVTFGSNTMELTGFGSSSDMSFGPIIDQCLRPMAWLRPVKMTATVNSSLLTVRLRRAQLRPNIARDELQPSRQPLRHMCSKFYKNAAGWDRSLKPGASEVRSSTKPTTSLCWYGLLHIYS